MRVTDVIQNLAGTRLREARPVIWSKFAHMRGLPWWDIAAMVALLAWICAQVYVQQSHQTFVGRDQITDYFPVAQRLLEGQGLRSFIPRDPVGPGYPSMLAVLTWLLRGDMFAAGKVIAATSSTLFLLCAYLLLRRVFNPITAFASMLLTMGINAFVWVSSANSTDIPFACLAMASLCFISHRQKPTGVDAILAGCLAGLATIVRLQGLLLLLFILMRVAFVPRHESGIRSKVGIIALCLLAFSVASAPWFYASYTLQGSAFHIRDSVGMDPAVLPPQAGLLTALLQALRQEPVGLGTRFLAKLLGGFPMVIQALTGPVRGGWLMAGPSWALIPVGVLLLLMRANRLRLWFLLCSGIWWASLVPIHFEIRYYTLLIPTFSALTVFVITSTALPDIELMISKDKWAKATPGYVLDRLVGSRLPGWLTVNPSGTSLASLVLIALLTATALSTVKRIQGGYQLLSNRDGFHHSLAQFVDRLQGPGLHRPIGVRRASQARYWIPRESGTPVAPLPRDDYESALPKLSYVLYDQVNDQDTLVDGWDDPKLSMLADPLHAPANLEAVYYKPTSYRAILYRILEQSNLAGIVSATASSALPQGPAAYAFDHDAQTWWSSALHSSENTSESITFDLGTPTSINRVWLLPRRGGEAFPSGLRIEVSQDGRTWQSVIEVEELPKPIPQNPQIFPFAETSARLVRITATQLRWYEDAEGYLVSLVEARISLAVGRPTGLPAFSIASDDLFFDPLSNELVANVHNQSEVPGQAAVEFSTGYSAQDAEYLGTVESSTAGPGGIGAARLSSSAWDRFEPGHCRPIWATVEPLSHVDLDLDTYGVARPLPQTVHNLVCSPREVVIDDFDYSESPLTQRWTVPPEQTAEGDVVTTYDSELGKRVMRVTTEAEDGFVVVRWMRAYERPKLTLWVKSTSDFIVYVRVRSLDGEAYILQYMPLAWSLYTEEFPEGSYVYYPLGSYLADGTPHKLERDVHEDFFAKTGMEVDYIEALSVRAYDELQIADLRLSVRK